MLLEAVNIPFSSEIVKLAIAMMKVEIPVVPYERLRFRAATLGLTSEKHLVKREPSRDNEKTVPQVRSPIDQKGKHRQQD